MLKYQKMTECFGCCLLGIDDDFGVEVSCSIMYIQCLTGVFRNSTFLWNLTLTLNLIKNGVKFIWIDIRWIDNLSDFWNSLRTCIRYMYIDDWMTVYVYVMKMSPLLFANSDTIIVNVCMSVHQAHGLYSFHDVKYVLDNV